MKRVEQERAYWNQAAIDDAGYAILGDAPWVPATAHHLQLILDAWTDPNPPSTIAEIGCGIGRLTHGIAGSFPHARVVAFDISPEMVGLANAEMALPNIEFRVCDGRNLDVAPDSIDFVYSMLTFQHLPPDATRSWIQSTAQALTSRGVFRFQIVTHTEPGPFSYPIPADTAATWCREEGMTVTFDPDGNSELPWAWLTARKS
jgi:SAM-dependent methyltransferase